MKYMLLIYLDEKALSETEREACYVESTQLAHDIQSHDRHRHKNRGVWRAESACESYPMKGGGLKPLAAKARMVTRVTRGAKMNENSALCPLCEN